MRGQRSDRLRLQHILDSAVRARLLAGSMALPDYVAHESVPLACQKLIEIIGEAANKLPGEWLDQMPTVPWRKVIGLRHKLVHDYDDVNDEFIWLIIHQNLPALEEEVARLLRTLPADS